MPAPLKKFVRDYNEVETDWKKKEGKHFGIVPLNQALETLCQNKPWHSNAAEVYAKVRLINRAYLANLQLNKKVKWPEWRVAERLAQNADSIVRPLRALRRLDRISLGQVVSCHSQLMGRVKKATQTWNISFCIERPQVRP